MNPLDLSGPWFLLFYAAVAAASTVAVWRLTRRLGAGGAPGDVSLTEPYEIACLRGGHEEVVRVSIMKLALTEDLRVVDNKSVVAADPARARALSNPVEREVATFFSTPMEPPKALAHRPIRVAARAYERRLEDPGLFLDANMRRKRNLYIAAALVGLWILSAAKIAIALQRGRPIAFLVVLTLTATCVLPKAVLRRRRTLDGDCVVEGVQRIFAEQRKLAAWAKPEQVAMVAAAFGIGAVPLLAFPSRLTLFPPYANAAGTGSGGSGHICGSGGGGSSGCGGCGG